MKNLCRLVYTISIRPNTLGNGKGVLALRELKLEKYKGSLLLKFAVVALAVFVVVSLIAQQRQIADKREDLRALQTQLNTQNLKNEELQVSLEDEEGLQEYAEKKARSELNYAKPGERVFVDAGAND